jgi:hypothetical protein
MRVLSRGSIGGLDVHDDLRQNFGFHSYSGIHPSYFSSCMLLGLVSALGGVLFNAKHVTHVMCGNLASAKSVPSCGLPHVNACNRRSYGKTS